MSVVFDSYLEVNKFNNAAEKCKTETDVKELCRKYLESKGMYVADKKPEPTKMPDPSKNISMTSTKPAHIPDWAKDPNPYSRSYDNRLPYEKPLRDYTLVASEAYRLPYHYDYKPEDEVGIENVLRENVGRMLGVELLKGDFIKFRMNNDFRLGTKIVEGQIRVLK